MELDFLNKVGETISNKGRDVAKKAKGIAEISSLNSQINNQEERIDHILLEIGRHYYKLHKNQPEGEIAERCKEVDDAYVEIKRLKEEILSLKGLKACPSCGTGVPTEACYCPSCGTKLPEEEEVVEEDKVDGHTCCDCGAEVSEEDVFCSKCGKRLKEKETENE